MYLKDADSFSEFPTLKLIFWANLGQKSQSCPFCLKIGTHGISRMLILIPALVLWISNSNSFLGKFSQKSQGCPFYLKIGTHGIFWMLILIQALVFSNFKPKSLGYWFLFWDLFFEIPNLNPFFRQIRVRKVEFSILSGSLYTEYLEHVVVRIERNICKQRQ